MAGYDMDDMDMTRRKTKKKVFFYFKKTKSFSGLVCLKSFVGAFNWTSTWLFYMLFCIHLPCRHLHISGNHFINIEILISTTVAQLQQDLLYTKYLQINKNTSFLWHRTTSKHTSLYLTPPPPSCWFWPSRLAGTPSWHNPATESCFYQHSAGPCMVALSVC